MSDKAPIESMDDELRELPRDSVSAEAIQSILEEMTTVYHEEGTPLGVKLANISAADRSGKFVYVQDSLPEEMDPPVTGPNILRLLDDLLAHEVAHINWSDLDSKAKFIECYPGWGPIPGAVMNILEDEYVDHQRKQVWYGMRDKLAYYVWLHMNTESRSPNVAEVERKAGKTQALLSAFFQTALAGYVKGADEVSPEILEFCSYAEPIIEQCRHEHDPEERFKLAHVVMQLLIRYAPDRDEVDEDRLEEEGRESHDGGDADGGDIEWAPDSEDMVVNMPDEVEEELEEMISEMMDDDEFPDDRPEPEPEPGDYEEPGPAPGPTPDEVEAEAEGDDTESGGTDTGGEGTDPEGESDGTEASDAGGGGESDGTGEEDGSDEAGDDGTGAGESERELPTDIRDRLAEIRGRIRERRSRLKVVN